MHEIATGQRARVLNGHAARPGPVILWMSREQRASDNWALAEARALSAAAGTYVIAVFCLRPRCGAASRRHFEFMLGGLAELAETMGVGGVPFLLRHGDADRVLPDLVAETGAGTVVCDFASLAPGRALRSRVATALDVPLVEVDARNAVPAWIAAEKQVYSAHLLRRRYESLLPQFLDELPPESPSAGAKNGASADPALFEPFDADSALRFVTADDHGPPIGIRPGERAARAALHAFIDERLDGYAARRGDPSVDGQSGLSPYLHFGQLSVQRAVADVIASRANSEDEAEFIDEAVVWRELADNFCLFQPAYARFEGFPDWARDTLAEHASDPREVVYPLEAFEAADTHDELWNAAQTELVRTGKMHNYMRMYWAKKILEWSRSPEQAVRIAVLLNDRYSLDGRESNGYAGIAWSIGGVHDRPWPERAVFGKIRYMNYNGAKRKFDIDAYVERATGGSRRLF